MTIHFDPYVAGQSFLITVNIYVSLAHTAPSDISLIGVAAAAYRAGLWIAIETIPLFSHRDDNPSTPEPMGCKRVVTVLFQTYGGAAITELILLF